MSSFVDGRGESEGAIKEIGAASDLAAGVSSFFGGGGAGESGCAEDGCA